MKSDKQTLDEMEKLLRRMTLPELLHFCEGTLRAATRSQRILRERFPLEWERFNLDVEEGRII